MTHCHQIWKIPCKLLISTQQDKIKYLQKQTRLWMLFRIKEWELKRKGSSKCQPYTGVRIWSDTLFLPALDPDPFFKFLWIRIRFSHFSGSGSGFHISLDPDSDPVSAQILKQKKYCRKVSKSDLSEENLKFMTKDRQKMKKATISY